MRPLFVLCAALLATGCALTSDTIRLDYEASHAAPVEGAAAVTARVAVRDARPDLVRVGAKKNGFGMEMGAIKPEEGLGLTVEHAVSGELVARGFHVDAGAPLTLSLEVTRCWNDFKVGFWSGDAVADFVVSAQLLEPSGAIRYARVIEAQGKEPDIMLMSGKNARLALQRALSSGVHQLFEDPKFLGALLQRPPNG